MCAARPSKSVIADRASRQPGVAVTQLIEQSPSGGSLLEHASAAGAFERLGLQGIVLFVCLRGQAEQRVVAGRSGGFRKYSFANGLAGRAILANLLSIPLAEF
jgi:hypothetical protein